MKNIEVNIFKILLIGVTFSIVNSVHAATLFSDNFNDANLSSEWEVERGFATMDNGWVRLQGSTPDTRDGFITTHEGSNWSDYHVTTRFNPLGGGDDWFNSEIAFRVQDMHGFAEGTYYQIFIFTPNAHPGFPPNTVSLQKFSDGGRVELALFNVDPGILNGTDNTVDIQAVGGNFDFTINGTPIGHFHDDNPILTGGIGLGAIWESTTRYDYVNVSAVPEPQTYAMLLLGLGLVGFMTCHKRETVV